MVLLYVYFNYHIEKYTEKRLTLETQSRLYVLPYHRWIKRFVYFCSKRAWSLNLRCCHLTCIHVVFPPPYCSLRYLTFLPLQWCQMSAMASQITCLRSVYSTVYSGTDQRKHQSFMSLAFVRGIHRWPVNSPYKRSATRKMFSFDDVIMLIMYLCKPSPLYKKIHLSYMKMFCLLVFSNHLC